VYGNGGRGPELHSVRMDGSPWHGEGQAFPKKVLDSLVKAERAGDGKARQVILRLLEGGYGLADDALETLQKSVKPRGACPARDSITACMLMDPLLFLDIMRTIAGKD
jgi:hypothetical protein